MASRSHPVLPTLDAMEPERPPPALISELIEEILLRVASPADLARASAACVSFRRLIADQSFLRRYRSIHPPLLLGFVNHYGFHPVEAPHPSAAVARIVAQSADFSFDYLPRPTNEWHHWRPCDVRNGRVLVGCRNGKGAAYWDFAVCDPLSRRYLLLPPITDDLLASVELQKQNIFRPKASFISPVGGHFTYDCCYWKLYHASMLIKLDMNTMQFCTVDLPPGHDECVIVESGRNKIAMFSLNYEDRSVDYYTFSQNGSEESHEWHIMSTIPLPADYIISPCFTGPAEGYIFLEGCPIESDGKHPVCFSLEIKSFKIERFSTTSRFCVHPYFGFPPFISPIRIQGYAEE